MLNTDGIDRSLDDYAIEEIGFTVYPVIEELPNGKTRAVNEKIRNLDPDKTEKIYINSTEAADDDYDDIKYDGLGEVKAEGNVTFKAAEWNPSEVDMTVVAIDPSKKVYDTRFVMSVSESADISSGKKMVVYISIKRLDTNQVAAITTTICYDNVSSLGETVSAGDGEKLLAFAVVNIPKGVSIEYTSIILSQAE